MAILFEEEFIFWTRKAYVSTKVFIYTSIGTTYHLQCCDLNKILIKITKSGIYW